MLERRSALSLLVFGFILSSLVVAATALAIGHVRMRRRQLAEAQAYARIHALRGLAERQRENQPQSASPRLRAVRR